MSTIITFSTLTPSVTQKLVHAIAEAPAPETTTRRSPSFFPTSSAALISAAPLMAKCFLELSL